MPSFDATKDLPAPVVRRLPKYLIRVQELKQEEKQWVSSYDLADDLGLTSSTVRQDLSHLDLVGVSKRGYEIQKMESVLRGELGVDVTHRLVIVGAGYLGCALALHGGLPGHGFETCGLFDTNPELTGTPVGKLRVRPMEALRTVVRRKGVELGVIAVPVRAAQEVADRLVAAGVRGLLNLTYAHIQVPEGFVVVDARILASLQELAYVLRATTGKNKKSKS